MGPPHPETSIAMKPAALLLMNVLVAGAAVGAYHLAVGSTAPRGGEARPDEGTAQAVRALEREVERLKASAAAGVRPPQATDRSAELARLLDGANARLRALEEKAGVAPPADPTAPDTPSLPVPSTPGTSESPAWTEEQIGSLRTMLDEVDRRKQVERETEQLKRRFEKLQVTLAPDDEAKAIALALDYSKRLREMFPRGSAGNAAEEREAALARMSEARNELQASFARFLPNDTVQTLMKAFPEAPKASGFTPRPRPSPDGK